MKPRRARSVGTGTRRAPPANLAVGALLTGLFLLVGLMSLAWTPYPTDTVDVLMKLKPPGAAHWFGTDHFGRDVLSLILGGAWNSISIGLGAVALGLAGGVPMGLIAAMKPDRITAAAIDRSTDLVFAFPALLSAVLLTAVYGPGAVNVVVAVGIFNIAVFARVTRGAAIGVLGRPFVMAATAIGRTRTAILVRHVLPNILAILLVQGTVQFAVAILAEAGLSYLGLGVQPPTPSWGRMLADAQTFMFLSPLQAVFPGATIMLAVLGLNLLGDGLRDLLDPRAKAIRLA